MDHVVFYEVGVNLFQRVLISADYDSRLIDVEEQDWFITHQVSQQKFFNGKIEARVGHIVIVDK
jgi:hypothetical protein